MTSTNSGTTSITEPYYPKIISALGVYHEYGHGGLEFLNGRQDRYVVPGPNVYLYVMRSSRYHVPKPGSTFTGFLDHPTLQSTNLLMYCGLRLWTYRHLDMMSLDAWDTLVEESKRSIALPRLRGHDNVIPACLRCNEQFNQSEIAC